MRNAAIALGVLAIRGLLIALSFAVLWSVLSLL